MEPSQPNRRVRRRTDGAYNAPEDLRQNPDGTRRAVPVTLPRSSGGSGNTGRYAPQAPLNETRPRAVVRTRQEEPRDFGGNQGEMPESAYTRPQRSAQPVRTAAPVRSDPQPRERPRPVQERPAPARDRSAGGNDRKPPRTKKKSRKGIVFSLILFAALAAVITLICPWEPISRATTTVGTADGGVGEGNAAATSEYEGLVISEAMASNRTAVPDETGAYNDWIEIWNSTDHAINLKNVGLSDRGDSIRFLFPDVDLAPDGRVVVFCSDTNAAEAGSNFHAKFKLSSVGETIYLFDPSAYQIDSLTIPIMATDESYALMDDGTFATVSYYSPGYPNTEEGNAQYRASTTVTDGELEINEVMADPKTDLIGASDGVLYDWIELHNTTDHTVYLDNYALSDKENKPLKWRFPEGACIEAGGYYLVYCSGLDINDDPTGIPHTNFKISAEHDSVVLSDSRGNLVDRVTIDNLGEDCTWGRNANGEFTTFTMGTPGLPNTQAGANQADYVLRQLNDTGVYISEIMASNDSVNVGSGEQTPDWIELYNSSTEIVDLSGYGLSDNIGRARRWQFPEGTTIAPGAYLTVLCDGNAAASTSTELHTNFKIRRAGGEVACLADPTGRVLDKIVLPEIPTNVSYGRTIGLAGFFYYESSTPGYQNSADAFEGYAGTPELLTAPGLYYETVYTGFTIPENCTVYYTTDGSIPTRSSTLYSGESLELNFTTVLRARAYSNENGIQPSEIVTGTYFINAYHSLPIVSLVCDPDVLWNEENGLFVTGDDVVKVAGELPFKNTVYRTYGKIPREGHIEYYLLDGTQLLDQGMQFELAGDYSLDMPQKSIKMKAKSRYGAKTFNAALFSDREYTEYKSLVLRNSGNDCMWTRLQDGFQSRMLDAYGTQVIHQAWNPVVVYINGVYWGEYNMRERVDRYFVAQHEGLSLDEADGITILHGSGTADYGSNKEYKAMIQTIKAGDPANNPEDLQYILDNVDVDNYLEYIALEMFVGNSDIGNIRFYKVPGGKWKWIFYDADYGLYSSSFDSPASYTKAKGMGQQKIDNTILLKLLSVPEYKDKFLRKLGDIFQFFTTDKMLEILEPLVDLIEPEMNLHWARWGEENDPYVISEVPTTSDGAYRYWESRVSRLRNVVKKRPNLLWGYIQDAFNLSDSEMIEYFGERPAMPADAV